MSILRRHSRGREIQERYAPRFQVGMRSGFARGRANLFEIEKGRGRSRPLERRVERRKKLARARQAFEREGDAKECLTKRNAVRLFGGC